MSEERQDDCAPAQAVQPMAGPGPDMSVAEREIAKCSKCGKCRSVCPVFLETLSEGMVARGRVTLAEALLSGEIKDTALARRYLWGCLKCLRCADVCPSAVDFAAVITEARRVTGRRFGLPRLAAAAMRAVTTRRWLFNASVRSAAFFSGVLPRRAEGKVRHLPLMLFDGRGIPEIARRSVLESFDEYHGPPDAPRRVALFLGCLVNYAYPEVARAMIDVLVHFGFGVHVPRAQACCGTPALSLGDEPLAARLARANAEAFAALDVEAVICGCASGGATLKKDYPALLAAETPLGAPVMDFAEFVAPLVEDWVKKTGGTRALLGPVSWHDPCHLKFVQKIERQPRQILSAVGDFKDFDGADYCCGMGGVFSAFFPDLSMKIAVRKADAVERAAPRVLATGCAGCMMQLRDRLSARDSSVEVMHVAQLLAAALGQEGRPAPAH